ncbi:MAG: hypothetical protein R3B48_29590 [Kofleriaceae bacterium]
MAVAVAGTETVTVAVAAIDWSQVTAAAAEAALGVPSVSEPPEHRADAIQHGVDCREVCCRDVATELRDSQRRRELARGAGRASEEIRAIEAGALARFADVERHALRGSADLIGKGLSALAELRFDWREPLHDAEEVSRTSKGIRELLW